ncbi:restriction endonuclease subunit S [Paenibacillus sp. MB22_1]|uniref:restriction endonuclease subunit S n=1 Tax=Paenibacillus sp. MB22_1 TaxID=3383121 RepID=UPI00399FADA8
MYPSLRFKGFSEQWMPTTIGAVSKSIDYGLNVAATDFDGENKYIRITDIDEESHLYIEQNKVSPEGSMTDEYLLKEGDILLARTGASTGKSYMYRSEDGKMYFAGFLIRLRIKETVDHRFVYYQTWRSHYNRWVKLMSMRSGQPGINASEYSGFEFYIPTIDEQRKISSFFSLLDQKIVKQEEKIKQLELFKKGMLQKIFSQEIRFKDENGQEFPEWGTVKLGDLGETYGGLSGKTKDDFGDGECSFITYMNVFTNTVAKIDGLEKVSIGANENQHKVLAGDILFTTSSETPEEVGMASVWSHEIPNVYLNSFCFGFRLSKPIDPIFLAYLLRSGGYRKHITMLAQGSTRYNLSKSNLMKMELSIPVNEEQKLIRDFFVKLDIKLAKEIEKLDQLETLKKGLMQQMIV